MPKGAIPGHKTYHIYNIPPDLYKDFKYLTVMMDVSINDLMIVSMQDLVEKWMKGEKKAGIMKLREIDESLANLNKESKEDKEKQSRFERNVL